MAKLNLREAIEQHKLAEFVEENQDRVGNKDKFDSTMDSMLKNKKLTHQTSPEDSSEN